MAIIKSGASTDQLTIDVTSKAGRATEYNINGLLSGVLPTFCATTAAFTIPATPTDMVTLTGGAGKVVRVQRVILSHTQTTAGINTFLLVKRTSANSGGTSTAVATIPYFASFSSTTASVLNYTANPTLGSTTGGGIVRRVQLLTPALATVSPALYEFNFQSQTSMPIYLVGISDVLALNFAGAALPAGLAIQVTFEWTEWTV